MTDLHVCDYCDAVGLRVFPDGLCFDGVRLLEPIDDGDWFYRVVFLVPAASHGGATDGVTDVAALFLAPAPFNAIVVDAVFTVFHFLIFSVEVVIIFIFIFELYCVVFRWS
jgi:hypothetical protein